MSEEGKKINNRYERLGYNMALLGRDVEELNEIYDDKISEKVGMKNEIDKTYERYKKLLNEISEQEEKVKQMQGDHLITASINVSFRELLCLLICLIFHYVSVLVFFEEVMQEIMIYKYVFFIFSPSIIVVFGLLLSRYLKPSDILRHHLWLIYILICLFLAAILPLGFSLVSIGLLVLTMLYPIVFIGYVQRISDVGDKKLSISVLRSTKDMVIKKMSDNLIRLNADCDDLLIKKERMLRDIKYGYYYGKSVSEKEDGEHVG